jgi:hypothetical protein
MDVSHGFFTRVLSPHFAGIFLGMRPSTTIGKKVQRKVDFFIDAAGFSV